MGTPFSLLVTSYVVQTVGSVALAVTLLALHRHYARRHLLHWAWSWLALAVYLAGATAVLFTAPLLAPRHPLRLACASVTMIAGYWQVGWLLAGTLEIARGRPLSRRRLAWGLAALALAGLASVWPFTADPAAYTARMFVRVGLRALAAASVFLAAAALVHRATRGRGFGPRAVAAGFGAYGLEQLHYFGMVLLEALGLASSVFDYAIYLGFADFLIQWIVGLGMVGWLLEDERARVEQASKQLRQARDQLRLSEAQWRALADGAPVLLWMTDREGRFVFFNRAWQQLLGDSAPQPPVSSVLDFVHPDDAERCQRAFRKAFKAAEPVTGEFRLRDRNGHYRWFLGAASPRRDPDGAFAGLVGFCTDITEHRRLQEQFLQAQKMETVGRLAGGVAHDFNNLLTLIVGHVELASARTPAESPVRAHLQSIAGAAERASRLVQQLLAFGRRQVVQPKRVALENLVRDLDGMLRRTLGEDVELVTLLPDGQSETLADPVQLEQVLLNLAVNARDAMPEGGRLTIAVEAVQLLAPQPGFPSTVPPGEYVCLRVRDTGYGIPAEILPRIFEPFFTTKGPGKGTGLGLATCYGIVQQSGGFIQVQSLPGLGTTFAVYLPRAGASSSAPAARRPAPVVGSPHRVLVVEDEPETRALVSHVLQEAGYTVHAAADAEEALAVLERLGNELDLLLTDVVMPGASGRSLAQLARQRWPQLPVLMVSGYADPPQESGPEDPTSCLAKPFTPTELLEAIENLLAARPQQP